MDVPPNVGVYHGRETGAAGWMCLRTSSYTMGQGVRLRDFMDLKPGKGRTFEMSIKQIPNSK